VNENLISDLEGMRTLADVQVISGLWCKGGRNEAPTHQLSPTARVAEKVKDVKLQPPKLYGPQDIADDVVAKLDKQIDAAGRALVTGLVVGAAVATGMILGAAAAAWTAWIRGRRGGKRAGKGVRVRTWRGERLEECLVWVNKLCEDEGEGKEASKCLLKVPKGWQGEFGGFDWVEEGEEGFVRMVFWG